MQNPFDEAVSWYRFRSVDKEIAASRGSETQTLHWASRDDISRNRKNIARHCEEAGNAKSSKRTLDEVILMSIFNTIFKLSP